jgi:hypothetical protein
LTAVLLAALVAGVVTQLVAPDDARGVWIAAAIACGLQLVSFPLLVMARAHANLFLAGWVGGMLLRFGALAVVAIWITRSGALPPAATLLSLAGFLFLLVLLEPVFLRRRGLRTT